MNPAGHVPTLVASHPGNQHARTHGLYARADQSRERRASEVADAILAVAHVCEVDGVGAQEIGRVIALIEALDDEIAKNGVVRRGDVRHVVKLRLAASRRLEGWLAAYGMTPASRARLLREISAGSVAAEIARRRAA